MLRHFVLFMLCFSGFNLLARAQGQGSGGGGGGGGGCGGGGDPHFLTFNGEWVRFQGTCKYTLARDNVVNGVAIGDPTWEVITNHNAWAENPSMSVVHDVSIILYELDMVIELHQNRRVLVNGGIMWGVSFTPVEGVMITRTPNRVYVNMTCGVMVEWDGIHWVSITIMEEWCSRVGGICGDCEETQWRVGYSTLAMAKFGGQVFIPGAVTTDVDVFGASWMAGIDENEPWCIDELTHIIPPAVCNELDIPAATAHCENLRNKTGPFKDCLEAMDGAPEEGIFMNCVLDSCWTRDFENIVCLHAEIMAATCQEKFGITVSWRSLCFCPMRCREGMEYHVCGNPFMMPTCDDPDREECDENMDWCEEGCFCKEGLVFDGDNKCIKPEECGCSGPGINGVINVGTAFLREDCTERCTCTENRVLECETFDCCKPGKCMRDNEGSEICHCPQPYEIDSTDGRCKEVCELPKDPGTGCLEFSRWYYDTSLQKCVEFTYSGEGGNANHFTSERACKLVCVYPNEPSDHHCCPAREDLVCMVKDEFKCEENADCPDGSICCPTRGRTDVCIKPVPCCCPKLNPKTKLKPRPCRDDSDCDCRTETCCWGGSPFNNTLQCLRSTPCPCAYDQDDLCCVSDFEGLVRRDPDCQQCSSDAQCPASMVCCLDSRGCSSCEKGYLNACHGEPFIRGVLLGD